MKRFYHTSPALSTPHRRSLGHPHPPHLPLSYGDFRGLENENSYTMNLVGSWIGIRRLLGLEAWRATFRPDLPTIDRVVELK